MEYQKITELPVSENADDAHVLITQPELSEDGIEEESARRIAIEDLAYKILGLSRLNITVEDLGTYHRITVTDKAGTDTSVTVENGSSPYLGETVTEIYEGKTSPNVIIGEELRMIPATVGDMVKWESMIYIYNGASWHEVGGGLDMTALQTLSAPLAVDEIPIYDISAGTLLKVKLGVLSNFIKNSIKSVESAKAILPESGSGKATIPELYGDELIATEKYVDEKRLWMQWSDTLSVTEEDITAAGDEGVTVLAVGNGIDSIPSSAREFRIHIYVPKSSEINTTNYAVNVSGSNDPTVVHANATEHVFVRTNGNTSPFTAAAFARSYGVNLTLNDDGILIEGEVINHTTSAQMLTAIPYKNVFTGPSQGNGVHRVPSNYKYFIIYGASDGLPAFKFPAGTEVKIWYR